MAHKINFDKYESNCAKHFVNRDYLLHGNGILIGCGIIKGNIWRASWNKCFFQKYESLDPQLREFLDAVIKNQGKLLNEKFRNREKNSRIAWSFCNYASEIGQITRNACKCY